MLPPKMNFTSLVVPFWTVFAPSLLLMDPVAVTTRTPVSTFRLRTQLSLLCPALSVKRLCNLVPFSPGVQHVLHPFCKWPFFLSSIIIFRFIQFPYSPVVSRLHNRVSALLGDLIDCGPPINCPKDRRHYAEILGVPFLQAFLVSARRAVYTG